MSAEKLKRCTICGEEKPATSEYYHKYKGMKDGLRSACKVCTKMRKRASYHANREKNLNRQKAYYQENKEKIIAYQAAYREKNKDRLLEYERKRNKNPKRIAQNAANNKRWQVENKEHRAAQRKEYYEKNKEYIKAKRKEYRKNKDRSPRRGDPQWEASWKAQLANQRKRRKEMPCVKLAQNVSRAVRFVMTESGGSKRGMSTFQHMPYTVEELKEHLESLFTPKMSWDNYGSYWHLDHIIPQAALPYISFDSDNFKKCWALTNLQPLEATANMRKGSRYNGVKYKWAKIPQ